MKNRFMTLFLSVAMLLSSCQAVSETNTVSSTTAQTTISSEIQSQSSTTAFNTELSTENNSTVLDKTKVDKVSADNSNIVVLPLKNTEQVKNENVYVAPKALSNTYNMNVGWKFTKAPESKLWPLKTAQKAVQKNGKEFYEVDYDDSEWEDISLPHAISSDLSFVGRALDGGDSGVYRGIAFYRKEFELPISEQGKKVFLEFEGARQAIYIWVNGQPLGYYEAGITASGFDLTNYIKYGEKNIIAVANDSTSSRNLKEFIKETKPGSEWGSNDGNSYHWNKNDFNPTQAGLTHNVYLHTKSDIYQTLPLYNNLKTTGNYIYASDFNIGEKTAVINVLAEIRNESSADKDVVLEVNVVDNTGTLKYTFEAAGNVKQAADKGVVFETVVQDDVYSENPSPTTTETVDVSYISATYKATDLNFWSTNNPYLYDVYTILKVDGKVIDVQKITTGFRKVEYTLDEGFKLNDEYVFLTGYAQRSTNEWAAIGVANDWITDYDMELMKESNANFIRWMHVAPKPNQIRSTDKYGIVSVVPAGDGESDQKGRDWDHRVEAMRDTIIYYRNSPSAIFWEAGNSAITGEHMKEMRELKELLDPNGERLIGCRSIQKGEQLEYAEWVGTMLNRHAGKAKATMAASGEYLPVVETEYHREEAPRRVWDDYSPPDYDYDNKLRKDGVKSTGYDVYDHTSESFVVSDVKSYSEFYGDRINGESGNNYYSAAAALLWADSNQHGRNSGSENARVSGRTDAIRVKKQSFYAYQVMQSRESLIHIVGHWSYPELTEDTYWYKEKSIINNGTTDVWSYNGKKSQRDPLHKTVYVVATTDCTKVELLVDGSVVGTSSSAENYFLHSFENIDITKGNKVEAVAYNSKGEEIARDEIYRSSEPYEIRLTARTGKDGLIADGSDYIMFDVDVVDKNGNICALNYDKISFDISGEGIFAGGYNSGLIDDKSVIGKNYVYAECGQNRVFVRATANAGEITLTASMDGIKSTIVKFQSVPVEVTNGLSIVMPKGYKENYVIYKENKNEIAEGDLYSPDYKAPNSNTNVDKDTKVDETEINKNTTVEKETNAEYTVTVNGTVIKNAKAYKPDDTIGILSAIRPVLYQIKKTGLSNIKSYDDKDGVLTLVTDKHTIIATAGKSFLQVDDEKEGDLMSVAPEISEKSLLVAELKAILKYIDNISIEIDDSNSVCKITVGSN